MEFVPAGLIENPPFARAPTLEAAPILKESIRILRFRCRDFQFLAGFQLFDQSHAALVKLLSSLGEFRAEVVGFVDVFSEVHQKRFGILCGFLLRPFQVQHGIVAIKEDLPVPRGEGLRLAVHAMPVEELGARV